MECWDITPSNSCVLQEPKYHRKLLARRYKSSEVPDEEAGDAKGDSRRFFLGRCVAGNITAQHPTNCSYHYASPANPQQHHRPKHLPTPDPPTPAPDPPPPPHSALTPLPPPPPHPP